MSRRGGEEKNLVLGPTQTINEWVPGVERLGHEVDHSVPSSAEVKNAWSYICTHSMHLHGVVPN